MRTLGWIRVLTCAVALGALPAFAEADVFGLGAGRDKTLEVQGNESRVINSYAAVIAPLNKGDREIRLDTLQGFDDGDLVMVLQMRYVGPVPASSFMAFTLPLFDESPVGKWEMARVERAFGRTLTLTRPLRHDFAAPYSQVIRVPEFKSVTVHPMGEIKARNWDGSTGGVVAFLVDGTLHNNGVITASGAGFQQGWAREPAESLTGCADFGGACEPVSQDVLLRRLPMGGGGAIFFRAHALTGAGRIEAKGLEGEGAPGGGSISARLVERAECEVMSVQGAPGGSPWLSGAQGVMGGGTILLQAGALAGCPVQSRDLLARAFGESSGDIGAHVLLDHALLIPVEPVVTAPKDGARIKGPKPRVAGRGDPGTTVILSLADAEKAALSEFELPATQVDKAGDFSFVLTTPLADGTYRITAQSEFEGLASGSSTPVYFTVDSLIPSEAPVIASPGENDHVKQSQPVISGTATDSVRVVVKLTDGGIVGEAEVVDGDWSLTPTAEFADGEVKVTATGLDETGAAGPVSASRRFTVDTESPPPPQMTAPSDGAFLRVAPVQILGMADGGTTLVRVSLNDVAMGEVAVLSNTWDAGVSGTVKEGKNTLEAVAIDFAGNESDASTQIFFLDTLPPGPPTIDTPDAGTEINTTTPLLAGTAEANHHVTLTFDGGIIGTATAGADERWELELPTPDFPGFPDGSIRVLATASDDAGNSSDASTHLFTVDITAPSAPVFLTPDEGSSIADSGPLFSGTAERNSTVRLRYIDGGVFGTAITDDAGSWSLPDRVSFSDGLIAVNAIATDRAGNTSGAGTRTFTIDTTPPTFLTFSKPDAGTHVSDETPTLSGTTPAGSWVHLSRKAEPTNIFLEKVRADSNDRWEYEVPLIQKFPQGPITIIATASDALGNTTPEVFHEFIVDTHAPARPVITAPSTAVVSSDKPIIQGTVDGGTTLWLVIDGARADFSDIDASTPVNSNGSWSYTLQAALPEDTYTLTAYATDLAANRGATTQQQTFEVDTSPPKAPTITEPTGGTWGPDGGVFKGSAEPGSVVNVFFNDNKVASATADSSGVWSVQKQSGLPHGNDFDMTASATDAFQREGPRSTPAIKISVDIEPPQVLRITIPQPNQPLNKTLPDISGESEPGALVTVSINGIAEPSVTTKPDGTWKASSSKTLQEGNPPIQHNVQVKAVDSLGNETPLQSAVPFTIDTKKPVTKIDYPAKPDTIFTNGNVLIGGTTEANSTVYVSLGTTTLPNIEVKGDGRWEYKPTSPLPDDKHTLNIHSVDRAGNIEDTFAYKFEVDSKRPNAPILLEPVENTRTNTNNPITFSGTFTPPCDLTVFIDKDSYSNNITVVNTQWTFNSPRDLAEGPHEIKATCTDKAGWVSEASNMHTLVVDRSSPGAPDFSSPASGASVGPNTPDFGIISGTTEGSATVTVLHNGNSTGKDLTADSAGVWSLKVALASQRDGLQTFEAKARDVAGNTGPLSLPHTFILDTKDPVTVVEGLPTGISTLSTVTFTMTTREEEHDVRFECTHNEGPPVECRSPYSLRALTEGPQSLTIKATDAAKNVEKAPQTYTWEFKRPKTVEGGGVGCSSTAGAIPSVLLWLAWAGWLRVRRRQS
ncbi:OmpA family protein [Myxococcus stipitatus DSM 14675]|uniref:OmpA family protein n=1 Tax=Myxococcus stipitatus (strain DSM 14675 / JCM 12634 / Mx s8) TaxID=1278073 RepID=L7U9G7_MYXSD|nr:Ig-like domain-containing protein [Myxococcus stipitatus]AGC44475.1 OmpA family protein [Myxococcus stipitatus DSM 14675]